METGPAVCQTGGSVTTEPIALRPQHPQTGRSEWDWSEDWSRYCLAFVPRSWDGSSAPSCALSPDTLYGKSTGS